MNEFVPPEGMPPELAAQIKAHVDHQMMHHQDTLHAIKQILESLKEEQLQILDMMLLQCALSPANAHFIRGQIVEILHRKFEVCPCGEKHNIEDLVGEKQEEKVMHDLNKNVITVPDNEVIEVDSPRYYELLAEYNVLLNVLTDNQGVESGRSFRCGGCGIHIASLQDRMLRKPGIEGCSGCQQKSAWG